MAALAAPVARRRAGLAATYLTALVIVAVTVVPILFVVIGGFRTSAPINDSATALPHPWVLGNYTTILKSGAFWRFLLNSAVIAGKGDTSKKDARKAEMEKANFKSLRGPFKYGNNHIPIQNF